MLTENFTRLPNKASKQEKEITATHLSKLIYAKRKECSSHRKARQKLTFSLLLKLCIQKPAFSKRETTRSLVQIV